MFLPILIAQLHSSISTMNVTVKEITSSTTFTVEEGFTVRIDCITPINNSQLGQSSLMNLIMPGESVRLEYNISATRSKVYAPLYSSYIDIGATQVKEGYATYSSCDRSNQDNYYK